jgi:hopanoid biosynthesis associated RND transporter like protein HpnN
MTGLPVSLVAQVTSACVRRSRLVIFCYAVLSLVCAIVAVERFSITTNTARLMPPSLPWVQRQAAYEALFPPQPLVAVVQAPTPELVQDAAARLRQHLLSERGKILSVEWPEGDDILLRAGLLFPSLPQVERTVGELTQARPLLGALAADPTLRGIMQVAAASAGALPPAGSLQAAATIEAALAGRFASFSWLALLRGRPPDAADLRQLILLQPALDFNALQPGQAATEAIRAAAAAGDIAARDGATVAITGQAAINDEQFSTLSRGAALNGVGTGVAVLAILVFALRSARIVLAVVLNLLAGLAITVAAGLLMIGAFNLISVAFAVLCVGLGADFGIQFAVRYRAERYEIDDIGTALRRAGTKAGGALALAAAGVTVGFFSFVPTDYRGIAELGQIAGVGMLIAFCCTITLLPALLARLGSPHEPVPLGYRFLAPVDDFLSRHRRAVVVGTIAVVLAGAPLLGWLKFDFNPMHLQDPSGEAVRTYRMLGQDSATGVAAVDVAAASLAEARDIAARLDRLPSVAGTRTVESFIPTDQAAKIALIGRAAATLLPALEPPSPRPPPDDAQTVMAIRAAAEALPTLRPLLLRLADAAPDVRARVADAMVIPLQRDIARLRAMLRPQMVTVENLPAQLRRDWLLPDGQARVQVLPKANPDDTDAMASFARAVLAVAPGASGTAIMLLESQRTVVRAFIEAGIYAVLAIAVILFITLRRVGDVLLTLVPLLVAGAVTLEITVLLGQQLNFANIIALPLLLGVGVAFKIYYILAWRRGATQLLQSTLTRAVFYSALTTMTAFGSLWLSNQPGMSSMGQLMALSLICTLLAAVLFQPALMGPPRQPSVEAAREQLNA